MPPELFHVLDACPTVKVWRTTPGRPAQPDLAGARERALLLVGFVAALRRSELAALAVEHVAEHPNGLVLTMPRSKTNQTGETTELVVLPRAGNSARCPVTALTTWLTLPASPPDRYWAASPRATRPPPGRCTPKASTPSSSGPLPGPASTRPPTAPTACAPGSSPTPTCAAPPTGPSPTRPGTAPWPPSGGYVRVQTAWTDNAATRLGL